jgi:hypothetical protein
MPAAGLLQSPPDQLLTFYTLLQPGYWSPTISFRPAAGLLPSPPGQLIALYHFFQASCWPSTISSQLLPLAAIIIGRHILDIIQLAMKIRKNKLLISERRLTGEGEFERMFYSVLQK